MAITAVSSAWVRDALAGASRSWNVVAQACLESAGGDFAKRRHRRGTRVLRIWAACAKHAAGRWIHRARDVALQQAALAPCFGIGSRRCIEQRLRVGMLRRPI